jgi:phenylacetate-CoA ligase
MEKITGRNDDMIILRGVNLFPTQIEEIVLATPSLSPHFVLELTTRERLDALSVKVERKPGVSDDDSERGRESLQSTIRGKIGVNVDVTLEPAGSLPRSEGKMKRVYDRRDGRS